MAAAVKNNGMLFPPPPAGFRHFVPKNTQGVLAKFCSTCGSHIDAHAYQWLTGGYGSVRACPPGSESVSGTQTPQLQHHQQNQSQSSNHRHQQQQRPYGSHSLHLHERDVDLSLTSSVVDDKKTVGNVPAHHRVYQQQQQQQQQQNQSQNQSHQSQQQQQQQYTTHHGDYIARDANGLPAPIPHEEHQHDISNAEEEELFYQQQQQQQQMMTQSQQRQQQQPQPGGDATAHFSRSYRLYDDAYSTPIPFGTDSDLVHPPEVAPPKGRRHIGPMNQEDRIEDAQAAQAQNAKSFPRMSAVRARMERGNLAGAGGINVSQDAVRPGSSIVKTHVKAQRRDAQSKLSGASGLWG